MGGLAFLERVLGRGAKEGWRALGVLRLGLKLLLLLDSDLVVSWLNNNGGDVVDAAFDDARLVHVSFSANVRDKIAI